MPNGEIKRQTRQLARIPEQIVRLAGQAHTAFELLEHAYGGKQFVARGLEVGLKKHFDRDRARQGSHAVRQVGEGVEFFRNYAAFAAWWVPSFMCP